MRLLITAICAAALAGCVEDAKSPLSTLPRETNKQKLARHQNGCRALGLEPGSMRGDRCLATVKNLEAARAAASDSEWHFEDGVWELVKAKLSLKSPHQK